MEEKLLKSMEGNSDKTITTYYGKEKRWKF